MCIFFFSLYENIYLRFLICFKSTLMFGCWHLMNQPKILMARSYNTHQYACMICSDTFIFVNGRCLRKQYGTRNFSNLKYACEALQHRKAQSSSNTYLRNVTEFFSKNQAVMGVCWSYVSNRSVSTIGLMYSNQVFLCQHGMENISFRVVLQVSQSQKLGQ